MLKKLNELELELERQEMLFNSLRLEVEKFRSLSSAENPLYYMAYEDDRIRSVNKMETAKEAINMISTEILEYKKSVADVKISLQLLGQSIAQLMTWIYEDEYYFVRTKILSTETRSFPGGFRELEVGHECYNISKKGEVRTFVNLGKNSFYPQAYEEFLWILEHRDYITLEKPEKDLTTTVEKQIYKLVDGELQCTIDYREFIYLADFVDLIVEELVKMNSLRQDNDINNISLDGLLKIAKEFITNRITSDSFDLNEEKRATSIVTQ